jgi:hypothetical protein
MKFGLIDAKKRTAKINDFGYFELALKAAGLTAGNVDFGQLSRHVHIVVWEYSLFAPVHKMHYFSVVKMLFGGNAVIFASDEGGNTIDLPMLPPVTFFKDVEAVELAIDRGEVERPQTMVNGAVLWRWPDKVT